MFAKPEIFARLEISVTKINLYGRMLHLLIQLHIFCPTFRSEFENPNFAKDSMISTIRNLGESEG